MTAVLVVAVAWLLLAVPVALIVGGGIKLADHTSPARPHLHLVERAR